MHEVLWVLNFPFYFKGQIQFLAMLPTPACAITSTTVIVKNADKALHSCGFAGLGCEREHT